MRKGFLVLLTLLVITCKNETINEIKSEKLKSKQKDKNKVVDEIKYVNTESGLIYRDQPKGKKLGKFDFNHKLIIDTHSGVFQKIKNDKDSLKGEWVGTQLNNQKVFVFNGFLSDTTSKSQAETNAEIDALTEAKIKEIIDKELRKTTSQRKEEKKKVSKEEMFAAYRNTYGKLSFLEKQELEKKWIKLSNEEIRPVKDTVVINDEISLLKNLKSNRVFLIDTPILNFHKIEPLYNIETTYNRFADILGGKLNLKNLKNVEFIGRKQRVYFMCYRYGQSLLNTENLDQFVFKNFCFYYPTSETDRKQKTEYLNKEDEKFYAIDISGENGKFVNCNINGTGFIGVNIYHARNITFENSTFSNIQKNVVELDRVTNIVLNNIIIKNNHCKSIIQMKPDEGSGSSSEEEISLNNCIISNNKTNKLLGFGKSFDNMERASNVLFKNCKITNNSFQRTFLNFKYKRSRHARFYNCEISNNKIFDIHEGKSPLFLTGSLDDSVMFKATEFNNNDWQISVEEREQYFN